MSFIPRNLNKRIRGKLLNFYINKLNKNTKLHDKIESEIIFSNYSQRFYHKIKALDLNNDDIAKLKAQLVNSNINIKKCVDYHSGSLEKLNKDSLNLLKLNKINYDFKKIFEILKITQQKFILPFAHLARGSFVSKFILQDFFSEKQINNIISSIETISTKYRKDMTSLSNAQFQKKYQHLVPNTYDFNNLNKKKYLIKNKINFLEKRKKFSLTYILRKNIKTKEIKDFGFSNHTELAEFMQKSISGREYAKYIFSRNIYLFFYNLKNWAIKNNIQMYDINFINKNIVNILFKK